MQHAGNAAGAEIDRICRALALAPSDHVLEIGSGWVLHWAYDARRI